MIARQPRSREFAPPHGPGCKPLEGTHSFRFPGEQRYVCVPGCPRRRYFAELERARIHDHTGGQQCPSNS